MKKKKVNQQRNDAFIKWHHSPSKNCDLLMLLFPSAKLAPTTCIPSLLPPFSYFSNHHSFLTLPHQNTTHVCGTTYPTYLSLILNLTLYLNKLIIAYKMQIKKLTHNFAVRVKQNNACFSWYSHLCLGLGSASNTLSVTVPLKASFTPL